MLIERPGDLWAYVQVTPTHMPPRLAERIERARQEAATGDAGGAWPEGRIPFHAFDRLFRWAGADTEPEDEAWLRARDGPKTRSYALVLLASLSAARSALQSAGPLIAHELARIKANAHAFAFLGREDAIRADRAHAPHDAGHTEAFYAKLAQLLEDEDVVSVAYRGDGDYRLLKMLCEAQRRRAAGTGLAPAKALEISALVNHEINNAAWEADVTYFSEGLGEGYLRIEESNVGGESVKDLADTYSKIGPGGYILSRRNEGDILGYQVESGDGWHLYRSEVSARMAQPLRRYHNVWSLMLAQENGEVSEEQVIEILSQWAKFSSGRFRAKPD
jgi:hypothetical protein